MAVGFKKKNRFINLLTGRFTQAGAEELPLHSLAFIGVRVTAVTALLAISLFVERIFIQKDIDFINGRITQLMKNEELKIPGRLRRMVAKDPKPVLDTLVKKQRAVRQEISTLQAAIDIQALSPLVTVSQIASSSPATLIDFYSNDVGEIKATFSSEDSKDLTALKTAFERSVLNDVISELSDK